MKAFAPVLLCVLALGVPAQNPASCAGLAAAPAAYTEEALPAPLDESAAAVCLAGLSPSLDAADELAREALGEEIAEYALQFVGGKYVWGGMSPEKGFDCSGLVCYTYAQFGYDISRVAADQAEDGEHVDEDELRAGDILCFYDGSDYIGHAGIYIGDGNFVHAQCSATGIVISPLEGPYTERGFEARRIV